MWTSIPGQDKNENTNDLVEIAVQTLKRGLQCTQGTSIQENLSKFLIT